jgi:O-antigen/teichoic acid export membrane protein
MRFCYAIQVTDASRPISSSAQLLQAKPMNIASGVRWVAVSQGIRAGSQVLSLLVLSRLLAPHAYGLIGMAMTVTNLAFMFRDLGTMVTIVQRPNLTDALTNTLFWINAGLAVTIFFILTLLAGPLAAAYREPALVAIICSLAVCIPISSLGAVQQASMERHAEFRRLARIEGISAMAGIGAACFLAYGGYGARSLVWQMLVSTAVAAALSWFSSSWRPVFRFDVAELRDVFGFTTHYASFQFVSYLQKNADAAIIGYAIGSVALGFYAMASKILLFPLQNISGIASRVLIPALSRCQHNLADVRTLFLRANAVICLLTAPFLALLFYLRVPVIDLVLGVRWHAAAQLFIWLVPAGFVQAVHAPAQATLVALGKARTLLKLAMFNAVSQVACIAIGSAWGLQGAACGLMVASVLVFAPTLAILADVLAIGRRELFHAYSRPICASIFLMLALHMLDATFARDQLGQAAYVALQIVVGASSYLFFLCAVLRLDTTDIQALFKLQRG